MTKTSYLIAVDLDDTVLDSLRVMNTYTAQVLRQMQAAGHRVLIATARPWCLTQPHYQALGLNGLVCVCNGAYLYHPGDNTIPLVLHRLSAQVVAQVAALVQPLHPHVMWAEDNDDLYVTGPMQHAYFEEVYRCSTVHQLPQASFGGMDAGRLMMILPAGDHAALKAAVDAIPNTSCNLHQLRGSTDTVYFEVHHTLADKWTAVQAAAQHYGIPLQHTACFGDTWNDEQMIMNAGHGYAMKNGSPPLLEKAPNVTTHTNLEGGVGRTLEALLG